MPVETPETIGKYRIVREIGRGAMAVVYEAKDPVIQRTVALKVLRRDMLADERAEEFLARFRREAQAAGRLAHPNIVAVYDCGAADGQDYIAMEYVEGRELRDMLAARERFTVPDVVRIMSQLLAALDYSHSRGVVHRDIKPGNIVIGRSGEVKVTDFGIARIESSTLTQAGTMLGSPSYMSPEQFLGQTVDRRSDLFSAGVILYEMLTGEKPFLGSSMSVIMHQVLKSAPIAPSELNVHVPPALDEVVEKALRKRPDERYQTAGEMLGAMRTAAFQSAPAPEAAVPARSRPAAPAGKAAADLDRTVMLHPGASEVPTASLQRRSRMLWIGAAAIVVVVFAGSVVLKRMADSATAGVETSTAADSVQAPGHAAPVPAKPTVPAREGPARTASQGEKTAQAPASKPSTPAKRDEQNDGSRRGFFGEAIKPSQWSRKEEGGAPW